MSNEEYISPFSARYASAEMSHLFSPRYKAILFRKLWVALAMAEKRAGLSISSSQIAEMKSHLETIDFDRIKEFEKRFRHDVMAHIHAFGEQCPKAKPIIHWGATSSYVTDNSDLIQLKIALEYLLQKMVHILQKMARLAKQHAKDPCLSYTHFQPAQPTTIGKRISLWLQDFFHDARDWARLIQEIPFLGLKGATGTQSSFLLLLEGSQEKVLKMEEEIAAFFGFAKCLPIAGQTYTRKIDMQVLHSIASFAASAHKFATDLRLLAHEGEMLEPFGKEQVGSSAMPYKKNPIYSERICGLARFAISLSQNPIYTAATQWLERSLDDSSNRRLSIPEAFLCADTILNTMLHILSDLQIDKKRALEKVLEHLPMLSMENILMESVKRGADRQKIHEELRIVALESKKSFDCLLKAIQKKKIFCLSKSDIEHLCDVKYLIGRAPDQVLEFLRLEVDPFLRQYPPKNISVPTLEV